MNFKDFFKITLQEINEEIEKDNKTVLNTKPLFESPMYHEAEYFKKLNDIKTNHPFALEIIENEKFIENVNIDGSEYRLFRNITDGIVTDLFISGKEGHEQVSSFVKYTPKGNIIEIKGLWQIDFVIGLVRGLIKNYYSKHYSVLKSDSVANGKGKKFFQNLAKYYIQQGKKVTVSIKNKDVPYDMNNADSYWKSSNDVQSAEKIIVYNF